MQEILESLEVENKYHFYILDLKGRIKNLGEELKSLGIVYRGRLNKFSVLIDI